MKDKPKMEFVIDYSTKEQTCDDVVRGIFGIGINELINNILINQDGKYDELYNT